MKRWLLHIAAVACFFSKPTHSFRRWYRDLYVFDHIEKFDCDTGGTQDCVNRCRKSSHCKIPPGEPSLYDIGQWRGCLRDVGSKCEFNFTMFLSFPVESATPYQATTQKPGSSTKSPKTPDTFSPTNTISVIKGRGLFAALPSESPRPFTKVIRFSNPKSRSYDKLEAFGLECDNATFVLEESKVSSSQLSPKFIERRKFLVLIDRDVRKDSEAEEAKLKVLEPELQHCLFSGTGKAPLLVFWLMEKAQLVTGYDTNDSFIKLDERDDFVMGRFPEEL